jgi:small subunit ribosomal protein S24e
MNISIVQEKENPLLDRKEVVVRISHKGATTPKRIEIRNKILAKLGAAEDCLILGPLKQRYGATEALATVKIYRSKKRALELERPHIIKKNFPTEEAQPVEEVKEKAPEAEVKEPKEVKGEGPETVAEKPVEAGEALSAEEVKPPAEKKVEKSIERPKEVIVKAPEPPEKLPETEVKKPEPSEKTKPKEKPQKVAKELPVEKKKALKSAGKPKEGGPEKPKLKK